MLSLVRPSADRLASLLGGCENQRATHVAGGLDDRGDRFADAGPLRTGHRTDLGRGPAVFDAARDALLNWRQFPVWAEVRGGDCDGPAPPPEEGNLVCVVARGGGLWWANPCRIYEVRDEPDCVSVAYVTLPGHVCRGEERFRLSRDADGVVWYDVRADSVLAHPLAKLADPLVRRKQKEFARDSLATVRRAVRGYERVVPRPRTERRPGDRTERQLQAA